MGFLRGDGPWADRPPDGHPERLCGDQPLMADEPVLWKGTPGRRRPRTPAPARSAR
ncbi:DUF6059 family protein [Streptomyces sp. NPDC002215]|uniref:DUF6059 family protein n=1 Tax=Streptomyces sp. NPDC002215 TaxID=3154412 RepID=UPI00332EF703